MKLKKLVIAVLSIALLFSAAACREKEVEQPKQEESKIEKTKQKVKQEIIMPTTEELFERFPRLKEIQEYLLNNYSSLNREVQEKKEGRLPIDFFCKIEGDKVTLIQPILSFDETVTKKEMIKAVEYISKEVDKLLSENPMVYFMASGNIVFTKEGVLNESLLKKRGGVTLDYSRAGKGAEARVKLQWKEKIDINTWVPFDPEEVKEGEELAYFGEEEQPQEETSAPAVEEKTSGITIDEIIEMLKENEADYGMNVEEFSREKEEATKHVISKGGNKEGSYTFEITANEYERAISGIYKVKRLPEMDDETFKKECMTYLSRAATSQYTTVTKLSVYKYMKKVLEYIMTGEETRTEFMAENTKFEIVSEEGNCIAVYVTSYAEKYEQ